jgi:hypothetical protein
MINPVSSGSVVSSVSQQSQPSAKPATNSAPQDTVHVSKQALAAAGDADHDGDSH